MQSIVKFMRRTKNIPPYNAPESKFIRYVSTGGDEEKERIEMRHIIHRISGPYKHHRLPFPIYVYFVEEIIEEEEEKP